MEQINKQNKIGIFGGSFNPPHLGHINAATTVLKKLGLDEVIIIPAFQNPLKSPVEGASPEDRLEMTKLAFESYGTSFTVDDREILKKGKSYTIETINELKSENPEHSYHLIVGMDTFESIGLWKDYEKILENVNLVVVTRPGSQIPNGIDELPEKIKSLVAIYDFNTVDLNTGKSIQFINLNDIEVSGSDLRKKIRSERNTEKFLPLAVEKYINDKNLYRALKTKLGDFDKFTQFCKNFLDSKKSINTKVFNLSEIQAPSEYAIITSGTSTRHAVSLAENLVQAVKDEYGVYPQGIEGVQEGRWVLVDYGSLIVHVFYDFVRQEYQLEKLWKAGKELI